MLIQNCYSVNDTTNEKGCSNNTLSDRQNEPCITNQTAGISCNQTQNVNKIPSNDTILKYVYKKNDVLNVEQKSKGHKANSLERRKRATVSENNRNKNRNIKTPLVVNYETNHNDRNVDNILPARITDKSIKTSNLADFNIETLHENKPHVEKVVQSHDNSKGYRQHRRQHNTPRKFTKKIEESSEEISNENKESEEFIKDKPEDRKNNRDKIEHRNRKAETSYESSAESLEADTSSKNKKNDRYRNDSGSLEIEESIENINTANKPIKNSESVESNEAFGDLKSGISDKKNKGSKIPIQNVDLDDFSYENIQVNEKGEVEVAPDKSDNSNTTKLPPKLHTDNKLGKYNELQSSSQENADISSSLESSNESNEPININDGEIKPVVEINSESESTENSNENIKEAITSNIDNKRSSLETNGGSNYDEDEEKKEKIVRQKNKEEDVKQQFERIPQNYNEAKEKPKNANTQGNTEIKNIDDGNNDGTLDTLTPKDNYDENLNIKFDDSILKLPEIKLPEDILAYAYEEPAYSYGKTKDKDEQRHYDYTNKNEDDKRQKKNKKNNNYDNDDYYGYYTNEDEKQDYKKKNKDNDDDDDDYDADEDLYEKFVRERFGKKDSFEKRSERLQSINTRPQDPQLYKTVKNILKKTEHVQKEAEKSGDPKAGYAWTLEYGENV